MNNRRYKRYPFNGQDPIIRVVLRLIGNKPLYRIADDAGVSRGVLYNWKKGRTKRPQFATAIALVRAAGGDIRIVRRSKV